MSKRKDVVIDVSDVIEEICERSGWKLGPVYSSSLPQVSEDEAAVWSSSTEPSAITSTGPDRAFRAIKL